MTLKEKLIAAMGDEYTSADDLAIERIEQYYEIYKQTKKHIKDETYRRRVTANPVEGVRLEGNERYYINLAFGVMQDCSKQIRADMEILGLSKKGKKLEIIKPKEEKSLLEQMNAIKDDE